MLDRLFKKKQEQKHYPLPDDLQYIVFSYIDPKDYDNGYVYRTPTPPGYASIHMLLYLLYVPLAITFTCGKGLLYGDQHPEARHRGDVPQNREITLKSTFKNTAGVVGGAIGTVVGVALIPAAATVSGTMDGYFYVKEKCVEKEEEQENKAREQLASFFLDTNRKTIKKLKDDGLVEKHEEQMGSRKRRRV